MPDSVQDLTAPITRSLSRLHRTDFDFDKPPAPDAHVLMRARGSQRVRAWDMAQTGGQGGPDFILLHGLGAGALLFQNVIPLLRRYGRVLVLDLPGFSHLPAPSRPMTIADFAESVEMLLDNIRLSRTLEVDAPVLLGHSMGTQVAVELARRNPHLGGNLALVAPVLGPGLHRTRAATAAFLRSSLYERPGAAMISVSGFVYAGLRWPARTLPAVLSYPFEERVAGLGGRLEIVRGTHDSLCPASWAESLLPLSGAQGSVHEAEGASHQVIVDHYEVVVQAALAAAGMPQDVVRTVEETSESL